MGKRKIKNEINYDLKIKVAAVQTDKITSMQVIEVYRELLRDAPQEYNPIVYPTVAEIKEATEDELETAKAVAIQLKKIIVNVMFRDITFAGKGYFEFALAFIKEASALDNKFLKKNLLSDGEGWYTAIVPFTIDYTDEVILAKTAALATVAANLDLISFEDGVNWLMPNFDKILEGDNKGLFEDLANAFMANDALAKEIEEVEEPKHSFSETTKRVFGKLSAKADEAVKEVEDEVKTEAKTSTSSSSELSGLEIAGIAVAGIALAAGTAYVGYKIGQYITSTEVISSNMDGNEFSGFDW